MLIYHKSHKIIDNMVKKLREPNTSMTRLYIDFETDKGTIGREDKKETMTHAGKVIKSVEDTVVKLTEKLETINPKASEKFKEIKKELDSDTKDTSKKEAIRCITDLKSKLNYADPKEVRNVLYGAATAAARIISPGWDFSYPMTTVPLHMGKTDPAEKKLVSVVKELNQYMSKDERQYSSAFQYTLHRIGDVFRAKDATQQLKKLNEVADDIDKETITVFMAKYAAAAMVYNVIKTALEEKSTEGIKKVLDGISSSTIGGYYPGGPASTTGPDPSATSTAASSATKMSSVENKTISHFNDEKNKLLAKLKDIDSKADKDRIASVNHDSVALIRGINSMLNVLTPPEKEEIDAIVAQIHASFNNRAARIGLKVSYINNVGKHDFSNQEADEAFDVWKADMAKWQLDGDIKYSHQDGNAYTKTDLDKFLEERREEFFKAFNSRKGLYNLRRDKTYDADQLSDEGENSAPVI